MLFRLVYDDMLAQGAYLVGCQRTGEAIVFDPERDVDRYVALARREGLRIVAAAETHIHADFLCGVRELAEQVGARVYVSGEGGADWNARWLASRPGGGAYDARALRHGEAFKVGHIEFTAMHTPGHTPEHLSYVVKDLGAGAQEPMGVITGDFVFVGDVGRPDLLETAAGQRGAKEPGARQLYQSVRKFIDLPDYLQVWPAHGAGSACGKALGAVPQSTVGYEKRFNASIRAAAGEGEFVKHILSGQPEPPTYFARMKRENRDGPAVLGGLPSPRPLSGAELARLDPATYVPLDLRPWGAFKGGHVPGAIFAPLDSMFINVVGTYLEPSQRLVLIGPPDRITDAVRALVRIGLDRVEAWVDASQMEQYQRAGGRLTTTREIDVRAAAERLGAPDTFVLDVRGEGEFAEGHLPGAMNIAYTRLSAHVPELARDKRYIVNCKAGGRSARACAYLQRLGYDVTNVEGGWLAWEKSRAQA